MDLHVPMKLFRLEKGILDSLMRQWNGFDDINILNFSDVLIKFALFFVLFSLADELLDRTPETKIGFELFYCKIWKFCLFECYDLFTRLENKNLRSRISSWKIFLALSLSSLSVGYGFFPPVSRSGFISLFLSIDSALQLLLCGVCHHLLSSLTLSYSRNVFIMI